MVNFVPPYCQNLRKNPRGLKQNITPPVSEIFIYVYLIQMFGSYARTEISVIHRKIKLHELAMFHRLNGIPVLLENHFTN